MATSCGKVESSDKWVDFDFSCSFSHKAPRPGTYHRLVSNTVVQYFHMSAKPTTLLRNQVAVSLLTPHFLCVVLSCWHWFLFPQPISPDVPSPLDSSKSILLVLSQSVSSLSFCNPCRTKPFNIPFYAFLSCLRMKKRCQFFCSLEVLSSKQNRSARPHGGFWPSLTARTALHKITFCLKDCAHLLLFKYLDDFAMTHLRLLWSIYLHNYAEMHFFASCIQCNILLG